MSLRPYLVRTAVSTDADDVWMEGSNDGHWYRREDVDAELASVRASRDALALALRWMEQFHAQPGEGANERFERIGEIFYRATGYLRPGKDCRLHSMEEREQAWDQWIAENLASARAVLAQHATEQAGMSKSDEGVWEVPRG